MKIMTNVTLKRFHTIYICNQSYKYVKMPIKSYVLHCEDNQKEILVKELNKLSGCEVIPAQNHEVIVIVTDTETKELDQELYNKLLEIKDLKHLSLVSGFDVK